MRAFTLFLCAALPVSAQAQQSGDPSDAPADDDNTIVVTGERLRGQVLSEQPPVAVFDEADIAGFGAGSITELLDAIGSETGSARGRGGGGRPVILVNGRRISSFRELRSYPPEAVRRVEVLPEEVAVQYGFAPNRRVVNFILRDNFTSREIELEYGQPFDGGFRETEVEVTYLKIDELDRLNANLEYNDTTPLTEGTRGLFLTDRGLPGDPDPAFSRTLIDDSASFEASLNWSRGLGEQGAGGAVSLTAGYERSNARSLDGLETVLLSDTLGTSAFRVLPGLPLAQDTRVDLYEVGASLDTQVGTWRMDATLNGSVTDTRVDTARGGDVGALQTAALAGTLAIDAPLQPLTDRTARIADTTLYDFAGKATASGRLIDLPAGPVRATFDAGYDWRRIDSQDTESVLGATQLTRGIVSAGGNLTVPIAARDEGLLGTLGDMSLNLGSGVQHLSDFGTLHDAIVGLNWGVTRKLDLQFSYIVQEEAPSLSQLGNPLVTRTNVPYFDFATGETRLVDLTTGGNPDLLAERQTDFKAAVNWETPVIDNSRLNLEYIRNRSSDVTSSFPLVTPAIEQAFPGRITRDAAGDLVAIDARPVTFDETRSDLLRTSLSVSGPVGAAPERGQRGEGAGGERRRDPSAMLRGGGRGRWRVSVDHTYTIADEVRIAAGGPFLDQLAGEAVSGNGAPRHRLDIDGFLFHKGKGFVANFGYVGPSRVNGSGLPGSSDLRFGTLATLDLRTFLNLEELIPDRPYLKGVRVSFEIDNVFDQRRTVTDETGAIPLRFDPLLLDPRGRFIGAEIRKIF